MLNIDFINIGEIDFDIEYKSSENIDYWTKLIKKLTNNIYSYQMNDYKIQEILKDDSKNNKWKVYAFAEAIVKDDGQGVTEKFLFVQSIIIYRLVKSGKNYDIYNIYQIGCVDSGEESDEEIANLEKRIYTTILTSMTNLQDDVKKHIIFYENIRESNILYKVYHDMESNSNAESIIVKMMDNGKYRDGETKILTLVRFKGKRKLKVFDSIKKASDFNKLILVKTVSTPYTKEVKKPLFENDEYKIYDTVSYNQTEEIAILHNENMVKQRGAEYFRKIIDRKKSVFLVAMDNEDSVVGYVLTRPEYSPLISTGLYNTMNFVGIVVSSTMRGKGLGTKLITMMEQQVRDMNQIEYIFGHVRFTNNAAQQLYRKMGYSLLPIGMYKDSNEIKYRIFKRMKRADIMRHIRVMRKEIIIGFAILLGHEFIHKFRDY